MTCKMRMSAGWTVVLPACLNIEMNSWRKRCRVMRGLGGVDGHSIDAGGAAGVVKEVTGSGTLSRHTC